MFSPVKALNTIPANPKKIHLIAICGTAMGALACMLKDLGHDVTGSDTAVYPPMSDFFTGSGIEIQPGFVPEHIPHDCDLVVVGNAVSVENPECQEMMRRGLPYCSMPQALNALVARGKQVLMVTGTHGKTTTSSLLAWLLESAGRKPSFFIGGILKNFERNYQIGAGDYLVVEGDEYDTAFFDKKSKFFHFNPARLILTSVEFDHADIFADFAAVRTAFSELMYKLEPECLLLAGEGAVLDELAGETQAKVWRYGVNFDSDWRLGAFSFSDGLARFEVWHAGELWHDFTAPLVGVHNLNNALACIAVAHSLGLSKEEIGGGLLSFQGVKRRQEVRGEKNGIVVLDDFAHHPTAVKATIEAVKLFYPQRRLVAVFEPRSNTSMRSIFQQEYAGAFDAADMAVISDVSLKHKVPQGQLFSIAQLLDDLKKRGRDAYMFAGPDAIVDFLVERLEPDTVVLIMSNGGFGGIHQKLLNAL